MSNELLRIHDENNNCDLVAVANPMGNFHMSTYAEMQDGTQKPVDGWYLFSKMIEKLGQGGEQPGSGPMVVDFTLDEQTGTLTGTKTVAEVTAAMKEGIVVAIFSTINSVAPVTKQPLGAAYWLEAGGVCDPGPFWGTIVDTSGVSISPVIGVKDGNWCMA